MRTIIAAVAVLALSVGTAQARWITKTAVSGKPLLLYRAASVNPDCSSAGAVTVRVVEPPKHGRVTISRAGVFPNFSASNVRQRCNIRRVAGVTATYVSQRGYQGTDSVTIEAFSPAGAHVQHTISIRVR